MSLEMDMDKCMHCGACVGSCPENVLFLNDLVLEVNEGCIECEVCVKACPVGALELSGD